MINIIEVLSQWFNFHSYDARIGREDFKLAEELVEYLAEHGLEIASITEERS